MSFFAHEYCVNSGFAPIICLIQYGGMAFYICKVYFIYIFFVYCSFEMYFYWFINTDVIIQVENGSDMEINCILSAGHMLQYKL